MSCSTTITVFPVDEALEVPDETIGGCRPRSARRGVTQLGAA
jgi:hypothetical protein